MIAKEAKGSVRDSLSLIDQILSYTTDNIITKEVLEYAVGIPDEIVVEQLCLAIIRGDIEEFSSAYNSLMQKNVEIQRLGSSIVTYFYQLIKTSGEQFRRVR